MNRFPSLSKARLALWGLFLGGNLLLFLMPLDSTLMVVFATLLLLTLWLIEIALLIAHRRFVAQWRAFLLFGLIYILARWTAVLAQQEGWPLLATLSMAIVLYAIFGLWGAMTLLAIVRDVSVAYLVIFAVMAPVLMRVALIQSGSVLAILQTGAQADAASSFSWMEPFVLAFACLPTLAWITFLPHFLWLWYKEWQRFPLIKESN